MSDKDDRKNPVVASLAQQSPHPYSSIAASPSRRHAIAAGKDTLTLLTVGPNGLKQIKSFRISQHFQTSSVAASSSSDASKSQQHQYGDIRETFGLVGRTRTTSAPPPPNMATSVATVICTDVAWSLPQVSDSESFHDNESPIKQSPTPTPLTKQPPDTVIAAAGSNGMVVVWNVQRSMFSNHRNPMPEAVLSQHTRAVNRLAWHPTGKRPELLLTASQDSTVKLWERHASLHEGQASGWNNPHNFRSWFGLQSSFHQNFADPSISWHCRATFSPNSEAIRDIAWSPYHDDVFAMVTGSGSLIVYNINVPARPWVKIAAHSGEATTVDWHPTRPYVIATGGGSQDRRVKIWDLESSMNLSKKDDRNIAKNAGSGRSELSHADSIGTDFSNDETTVQAGTAARSNVYGPDSTWSTPSTSISFGSVTRSLSTSAHSINSARAQSKFVAASTLHVLSISAPVTRLRWRPPTIPPAMMEVGYDQPLPADRHDSMLAVATAPIKGASAGGYGVLSLWSYNRPFMALSVLEGHKEGAVVDFLWLDTPNVPPPPPLFDRSTAEPAQPDKTERRKRGRVVEELDSSRHRQTGLYPLEAERHEEKSLLPTAGIWQHVLSVGRDGRCLIQSFARGERLISRVSPSCFAMANLSPFQSGYGSLQVFSVHQQVPSGPKDDFLLTGLRRDSVSARAPGVFQELPSDDEDGDTQEKNPMEAALIESVRHPAKQPELVFNVLDQGALSDLDGPECEKQSTFMVAPEVVHLSRFADSYKFYLDEACPTRVDLCLHNSAVAESLHCGPLSRMWRMLASILEGSGLKTGLPQRGSTSSGGNAMSFVLLPTLRSLLEQRADAGDVQTCVAICEVMQVIGPSPASQSGKPGDADVASQTTRIPGLELNMVREWYLSYIDLLQQMCLFSHASNLIRNCNDAFIGALSQKSTTIHESCPNCRKPLMGGEGTDASARRACKNCRRRVGLCFLCHEPVKGVFVWCPGCGHGGHLDCALHWFGGMSEKAVREVCPTGCGHKCNLVQQVSAFPRTASLARWPPTRSNSGEDPLALV